MSAGLEPRVQIEVRLERWASEHSAIEVAALIERLEGVHVAVVTEQRRHGITEFDPCPCGCEG